MQNPFRFLETRDIYTSAVFKVREDQIEKPGGRREPFAVIEMKAGASALPITDDGDVYLICEYKYAIGRESLEAASGAIDEAEDPLEAAKRELREEVGLTAREWIPLGTVDPFTTQLNSPNFMYLARGLQEVEREPDDGEVIEVAKMPFAEAVEKVMRSEITHGPSCVLILRAQEYLRRANWQPSRASR